MAKVKEKQTSPTGEIFNNRKIIFSVIIICFVIRLVVAIRPLEYIDGLTIIDDAYLSLTIAKNISKGLGPLYSDNYTNGFQPLYVFLMVPVYLIFPNDLITPVHIALIISALFDTLTLLFLFKILSMICNTKWAFYTLSAVWLFNSYIIKNTLNGLETAISLFFIVLALFWYYRIKQKTDLSNKSFFILGIIIGFAALARIDNLFLLLSLLVVLTLNKVSENENIANYFKKIVFVLIGCVIIYSPWLIYSYIYTGDLYPVSGKAVRYMSLAQVFHEPTYDNWYSKILSVAFSRIFNNNWVIMAAFVLTILMSFFILKRNQLKGFFSHIFYNKRILVIFSLCLFCSYSFYIFTFWFFDRYFYPIALLFIMLIVMSIDYLNFKVNKKSIRYITSVLLAVIIIISFGKNDFQNLYFSKETKIHGYMNIGLWANQNIKPGTIIGSSQTGALGYFADNLKVINLDGVVNKGCYESFLQKRNIEYIHDMRIKYIIGWEQNIDFIKRVSSSFNKEDLTFEGVVPGFSTRGYNWLIYRVNYSY